MRRAGGLILRLGGFLGQLRPFALALLEVVIYVRHATLALRSLQYSPNHRDQDFLAAEQLGLHGIKQARLSRALRYRPGRSSVTISEFNSTKYVRQEANVAMTLELREHVSGRPIYRDEVKAHPLEGSLLALNDGVFGSVDDLQAITQSAMNQAIDAALNKPEFAGPLRSVSAPISNASLTISANGFGVLRTLRGFQIHRVSHRSTWGHFRLVDQPL